MVKISKKVRLIAIIVAAVIALSTVSFFVIVKGQVTAVCSAESAYQPMKRWSGLVGAVVGAATVWPYSTVTASTEEPPFVAKVRVYFCLAFVTLA